jgi:Domain of unknown function (DUF6817)
MNGALRHAQQAVALLEEVGAEDTEHPSGTLLQHLQGTYEVLDSWGCSEAVCLAGLYHSIYGTEVFQTTTIPLDARARVQGAIGDEAEELAFLFCVMRRSSLYANLERGGPYTVMSRDGGTIELSGLEQFADLLTLDVANRLEQLDRTPTSSRRRERDRRIYERAVPLLPAAAVEDLRKALPRVPRVFVALDSARVRVGKFLGRTG